MAAFAYTYTPPSLKQTLVWSALLHGALVGAAVLGSLRAPSGELWGGTGGGAMRVGLVGQLTGVPLPRPEAQTPSRVVDETRGLHESQPKPRGRWGRARTGAGAFRFGTAEYATTRDATLAVPVSPKSLHGYDTQLLLVPRAI